MSLSNEILYCLVLCLAVAAGLTLFQRQTHSSLTMGKRFISALVYYGIPFAILEFAVFRLFLK